MCPLLYRGYGYDTDTGFYYLQSRYYNPEIGRFLNADSQFDEGSGFVGYNLFVYCANNPVMYKDDTGEGIILAFTIIGIVVGVIGGSHIAKHKKGLTPEDGWEYWQYVVGFGVVGGTVGALIGWGASALIAKYGVGSAATSITKGGGARFSSFDALKKSLGSPGPDCQWHHIVEQCQIKTTRSNFCTGWIQNSNNVINIPSGIHSKISAFYSSIPNQSIVNTGGKVFRDWLTGMSFKQQYKWGIWVLRYFGVKI